MQVKYFRACSYMIREAVQSEAEYCTEQTVNLGKSCNSHICAHSLSLLQPGLLPCILTPVKHRETVSTRVREVILFSGCLSCKMSFRLSQLIRILRD